MAMKILFCCDVLGEENNGTTIATMNVARSLRKKGHEVRILCPDEMYRGQEGFYICPRIHFGPFDNYVKSNGVTLASKKDKKIIEEALKGVDIVHFNFCGSLSSYVVKLCNKRGIPTTASMHTQAENFTNQVFLDRVPLVNYLMYRILYKNLFSKVDAIHYPSQFIHDLFEKKMRFKSNGYVISNGVKHSFHKEAVKRPEELRDKFLVLFTGRYSKEKNHKVLFKAMKYSKHQNEIQWILAGSGPLEKKFRRWSKKWPNPPIFGFHPQSEMNKIVNMADLYCHVSRIDIEPISCLEALSVGLPPLLSDSPNASVHLYAMDQDNLFHWNKPKDLAKKLDWWFEHPEERAACAAKYIGYAQQFDFDTSMDKMEQMYLKTIEEFGKHEG